MIINHPGIFPGDMKMKTFPWYSFFKRRESFSRQIRMINGLLIRVHENGYEVLFIDI